MNKKLIRIESADGEVHFQVCEALFCAKAKKYDPEEAIELTKREAKKPLLLNQKHY